MAKIKNYVELSKVSATNHIATVVVPAGEEVLAHGQFIELGKLVAGKGVEATDYTKAIEGKKATAFIDAISKDNGFSDYDVLFETVKGGKAARAYVIQPGMTIAINEELAEGIVAGDNVTTGVDGVGFKKAELEDEVIGVAEGTIVRGNVGKLVYVRFV